MTEQHRRAARERAETAAGEWIRTAARAASTVALLSVVLAGCRDTDGVTAPPPDSNDPLLGTYQAVQVNGTAVPFAVGQQGTCGVQHLGGSVTLGQGMTYVSQLRRLRTTCPTGATQESHLNNVGTFEVRGDSIFFSPGGESDPFFGGFQAGALHIRHTSGDYVLIKA